MVEIINDSINNKKVILRLDFNVTIKDNVIVDDTKIKKTLNTINFLLNNNNKLLIMSHLGRIKTEDDKKNNDLKIVSNRLSELLNKPINFVNETKGKELEDSFNNNLITLMQNTRYEDLNDNSESKCNINLAKYWASLGDIFVNDAFATSHRKHASNYGISKFLPSYYGFLIAEEIKGLDPIINVKERPFTVLMGGAKVDDKIALIKTILKECNYLLLGGGIANTFVKANNYEIGNSLYSEDYIEEAKMLLNEYKGKIILPVDFIVEKNGNNEYASINNINKEDIIYDIGSETIKLYESYLNKSKLIFINGTVGLYENVLYKYGTEEIFKNLNNIVGLKIVGGGDAVSAINKLGLSSNADFLSTGGGATLDYIANKKMECFED